jgi:hypothetical protein
MTTETNGPRAAWKGRGRGQPARRRIWCETVPLDRLAAPDTVALLRRFDVAPIVAVWPSTAASARAALARYDDAGLPAAVWPMLPDDQGRWLSAANAAPFAAFVERLVADLAPHEVVLDLEPPIETVRPVLASLVTNVHRLPAGVDPATFRAARARLSALVASLRDRGVAVSAAVPAPVLFDREGEGSGFAERMGTPVSGIPFSHASVMLYTSIFEGWSHGVVRREDARAVLGWGCRAAAARFGARAGASLGAVGPGAFGDEPSYRSVAELADDVAVARAAGVDDLALFDLGGVLRRPPAEAWLDALTATPPAPEVAPLTFRARAILGGGRLASEALGALGRLRDAALR